MPISKIIFVTDTSLAGIGNGHPQEFVQALLAAKQTLDNVKGFISVSVKWRPMGKFLVNRSAAPLVLGEDAPRYAASGQPELAALIEKAAEATGLWAESTEEWGLDSGHWRPLIQLCPEADLTVVPLSLSQMSPEAHRKWGVAIRRGAQKWPVPLALVVNGSLSARLDLRNEKEPIVESVKKFDDEIVRMLRSGKIGEMDEMDRNLFKAAQPEGGWGALYCLWGALGENIPGLLHHYSRPLPGVGIAAFSFSL